MKTAISYLACDRPELVKQSLPVLVAGAVKNDFHLFVIDGSVTGPGEKTVFDIGYPTATIHSNVRGGAGAAIVYALTMMLKHPENYDVVGLCEADVLLGADWFDRCFGLFERGLQDGLEVGAVSARCFDDRILLQRDGYAVMHNIGAGHILFTRAAAEIVLRTFRTPWSSDNRRIFAQLSGIDIGSYWAFRTNEHYLTADWHWDAALASHGLASLALTPSPVEMIGQDPPLAEQGLAIVREPSEQRDIPTYSKFLAMTAVIRSRTLSLGVETQFHHNPDSGMWTYFPHQMHMLGGHYEGDWHLKEARGWGTFAWLAGGPPDTREYGAGPQVLDSGPALSIAIFGPCAILVSGGELGGKFEIVDEQSGFKADPELPPEGQNGSVLQLVVPGAFTYRNIRITALTPGVIFYGLQTRDKQPFDSSATFDYSNLPPV